MDGRGGPKRLPMKPDARKLDFLLKPRFSNTLPDIPFEGKFMNCPFVPITRFCEYKESTVEKEFKYEVVCDEDMGLNIDLIDLIKYDQDDPKIETPINEKDQILLDDDNVSKINLKRSAQHSRLVPWMRKTEYISTEYNRLGVTADRQETKLGYHLKKTQKPEEMYRDRDSQVAAIKKTFEDVKKPIKKHYSKQGVHAVEECYVFPDFQNWKHPFAIVNFDGEAVSVHIPESLRRTAAELSMIRGMQNDTEAFAALFSPTIETIQKQMEDKEAGRPYEEDEKYEYVMNREYDWKLEPGSQDHDNFVLSWRDGEVKYNELESMVKMTRKRQMYLSKKSKLSVQFRDPNDDEMELMQDRFADLFKPPQTKRKEAEERKRREQEERAEREERAGGDKDDSSSDKSEKSDGSASEKDEDSDKESGSESGSGSDDDNDKKKEASPQKKKVESSEEEDSSEDEAPKAKSKMQSSSDDDDDVSD